VKSDRGPLPKSDPTRLAMLRTFPCCMCGSSRHVQAHHPTMGRGMSQKSSDAEAFPLCLQCHNDFHNASGFFRQWDHERRTAWQREMTERYQRREDVF